MSLLWCTHLHLSVPSRWPQQLDPVGLQMMLSSYRSNFVAYRNSHINSGRFRHSRHFHDGGPILIGPYQEVASVGATQRRAMSDTEYSRAAQPFAHQSIEPRLGLLVDRRSSLVEEEPIGSLDQRSGECDALLFAGRKLQRPMAGLAEPPRSRESPTASSASRSFRSSG